MGRNTVAHIDSDALAHNLVVVREHCPDSRIMAVVKADAYGHRLEYTLPALAGADMLAVASLEEARAVRALDNHQPVLMLEGFADPEDLPEIRRLGLEVVVHEPGQMVALEQADPAHLPLPRIWLKLDSGMHRLGFPGEDAPELQRRLLDLPGIEEVSLMSHFACADDPDNGMTAEQIRRFDAATGALSGERTLANSAGLLAWPDSRRDWVRAGIVLYGISPLAEFTGPQLGLKPAMHLETVLIAVNEVPAGEAIGYGARYRVTRDSRIGIAAIGYGDGYPRNMPDGTPVLVNGREAPLVGAVSMDMIAVDLTDQPGAATGDPVVLWGRDDAAVAQRIADEAEQTLRIPLVVDAVEGCHQIEGPDSVRGGEIAGLELEVADPLGAGLGLSRGKGVGAKVDAGEAAVGILVGEAQQRAARTAAQVGDVDAHFLGDVADARHQPGIVRRVELEPLRVEALQHQPRLDRQRHHRVAAGALFLDAFDDLAHGSWHDSHSLIGWFDGPIACPEAGGASSFPRRS